MVVWLCLIQAYRKCVANKHVVISRRKVCYTSQGGVEEGRMVNYSARGENFLLLFT